MTSEENTPAAVSYDQDEIIALQPQEDPRKKECPSTLDMMTKRDGEPGGECFEIDSAQPKHCWSNQGRGIAQPKHSQTDSLGKGSHQP